jgi:carbon monoxide dehydrogenase subunit G
MPAVTFHNTIKVGAPADQVWDQLQEPDIWRSVGPVQELWDPVIEDGVLAGFQWSTNIGGIVYKGTGTATIQDRPDQYQLVLDTSEMAGTITVDLSKGNRAETIVDVTLELRSKGILSSMFFPVVSRAIGGGLPAQVEDMAAQLSA